MSSIECRCNATTDVHGEFGTQPLLLVEQLSQALAIDELHDDCLASVVVDRVVHRDDVWMTQTSDGDGLAAEAFSNDRVGREARLEDLHGDLTTERHVGGEPHLGHAPLRDFSFQAVSLGNKRRWWQRGGVRCHVSSANASRARRQLSVNRSRWPHHEPGRRCPWCRARRDYRPPGRCRR